MKNTNLDLVVLFRQNIEHEDEIKVAKKYFNVAHYRSEIKTNQLVIGRFSVLPYYHELNMDVNNLGGKMLQSYNDHQYIASSDYISDLEGLTPRTWDRFQDIPEIYRDKPLIVKGKTNSRKSEWNTKMFANNFREAVMIGAELNCDPLIGQQGLIIREYNPLVTYEVGINGLPRTCEYRLFYLKEQLLAHGYYWGSIEDMNLTKTDKPDFLDNGIKLANRAAKIIAQKSNFFVIDVAKKTNGEWTVIEVNDGQMSGTNDTVDMDELYGNLKKEVNLLINCNLDRQNNNSIKLGKNNNKIKM